MVKLNAIIISFLISFTILSSRCSKHCIPVTTEKIMIPQEVLDYVDFKTGTYWISKDSVTGKIDSIVVTESKHIMEGLSSTNSCGEDYYERLYENILVSMKRFDSAGNLIVAWTITFDNGPKMHGNSPVDEFTISSTGYFKIGYPFDHVYHTALYTIYEYKTDSLINPNLTFFQVLNVKDVLDNSTTNEHGILSWAKNIGIIQSANYSNGIQTSKNYVIRYKIN